MGRRRLYEQGKRAKGRTERKRGKESRRAKRAQKNEFSLFAIVKVPFPSLRQFNVSITFSNRIQNH